MVDNGDACLGGKIQSELQKKKNFWEECRQLQHRWHYIYNLTI